MATQFSKQRSELMERPDSLVSRSTVQVKRGVGFLGVGSVSFQVETVRTPDNENKPIYTAFVTFVDEDGQGNQWMVPGPVVVSIARHIDSLSKRNRSIKAKANARPNAFKPKAKVQ